MVGLVLLLASLLFQLLRRPAILGVYAHAEPQQSFLWQRPLIAIGISQTLPEPVLNIRLFNTDRFCIEVCTVLTAAQGFYWSGQVWSVLQE